MVRNTQIVGALLWGFLRGALLDDRVVEAVLAVRYEERDGPLEWKAIDEAGHDGTGSGRLPSLTIKVGGSPQVG